MASTSITINLISFTLPIRKPQAAKCSATNNNNTEFPSPDPTFQTTIPADRFPLEKRRNSEILRDRAPKRPELSPPPNFEIGWKRTKKTQPEKPVGHVVIDFLEKLDELIGRGEFGSTALLAKAAEIVAERAKEEAEVLVGEGRVEERMVTELARVLKLMQMDMVMVASAKKEETLVERLEVARARCRQAILVAASF